MNVLNDESYPHPLYSLHSGVTVEGRIDWRLHPNQSHSDYTIEIVMTPYVVTNLTGIPFAPITQEKLLTYHVHRNKLACGRRRSLFFLQLFQKNYMQHRQSKDQSNYEHHNSKCRLYMSNNAAKVFPDFLKYMYSIRDDAAAQIITEEVVVALHFLAKVLQVPCLRDDTERFYKKNLSVLNCYKYHHLAYSLADEEIMEEVTKTVLANLSKIKVQQEIMSKFHAIEFWKHIAFSKHRIHSSTERLQISTLIGCFCKLHRNSLSMDNFILLTNVRCMPILHHHIALILLEISREFLATQVTDDLSRLQIRCLDSIATAWKAWMSEPNFQETLSTLNVSELCYLLNNAVNTGSSDETPLMQSTRDTAGCSLNKTKQTGTNFRFSRAADNVSAHGASPA
jgi:BTB/POZ domain